MWYIDVILPFSLPNNSYTYSASDEWIGQLRPGVRVEVQFGKSRIYSGIVERVHRDKPSIDVKPILGVLDETAVIGPKQLTLWRWMAEYYCCRMGDLMSVALPGFLRLSSETKLVFNSAFGDNFSALDADEYLIAEGLFLSKEMTVDDAQKILGRKQICGVIQRLLFQGVLSLREDLEEPYVPRLPQVVALAEPYRSDPDRLSEVFDKTESSPKQSAILLAWMQLSHGGKPVHRAELLRKAKASATSLLGLIKKNVFALERKNGGSEVNTAMRQSMPLTAAQEQVVADISSAFEEKKVVLLHGVTGGGKTRIYEEFIRRVMAAGGQALYLLPEIALTAHMIERLRASLGVEVAAYHSRIGLRERSRIWRGAASGLPFILSARSGIFLPFANLKLIIVDEEHDPSFKQQDPAPRYHARDVAIYLSRLYEADVILGSATPSVESFAHAQSGKYAYATLNERYGGAQLPEIELIDLRMEYKEGRMSGLFSEPLLAQLRAVASEGRQAIVFQNRRGYAPILQCKVCGWSAGCRHCDVSLTYHRAKNSLICHYCAYTEMMPRACPACGSTKIVTLGHGTQKIEDELGVMLPDLRIERMDMDTASGKKALHELLANFEERAIDVLVGTQMVAKGLDFDNVGLVGVVGADQLLRIPDFRAGERAFQLLTQVAGRAGRGAERGRVLIQTFNPAHPVLTHVVIGDQAGFYHRELAERRQFYYPPFCRLILLVVRHKDEAHAQTASA
ncbi:MAG: primosomal protein N', partial [Saprospiraceae bacterium]